MMKLSRSQCLFISFLIAAGFLNLAEVADAANEFRKCYNTSVEMHCFDAQYDSSNNRWLTASFENARQRCNNLNSTLPIIKDEETNNNANSYISDPANPSRFYNVWTHAYRTNDDNYAWRWVNSKLPNLAYSDVGWINDLGCYTATLEFRTDYGKSQFYLTAKQPQFACSYLCEYSVSRCPSSGSNVIQFSDRCYISFVASLSWYEARNMCLKDGGDLASFANVTSINFTSWLGSDPNVRFWIGLRLKWYIWKDSGEDVKFSNWKANYDWSSLCLAAYSNRDSSSYWLPNDCNADSIHVVCHTVTPLQTTTLSTITTTLPVTTAASIAATTGNTSRSSTEPTPLRNEKSTASSPIALGVGVGVGVGVPVIVAIIVIVICAVRRYQSKSQANTTTRQESREDTSHTEYQNNNSEDSELNHYAIVRPSSPPKMVQEEPSSEPQYAILGFNDTANRKSDIGHFPLNVL